jgi:hypothetical protein
MKLRYTLMHAILIAGLTTPLYAADEKTDQNEPSLVVVPEPPPIPKKVESGETLEPTVTIKETENKRIEEYSVNGKIYAIRITPKGGTPYYLVDGDGDGNLDTRRNDLDPDFLINNWVIFSW